jgi:hypothetical protein
MAALWIRTSRRGDLCCPKRELADDLLPILKRVVGGVDVALEWVVRSGPRLLVSGRGVCREFEGPGRPDLRETRKPNETGELERVAELFCFQIRELELGRECITEKSLAGNVGREEL